MANLLTLCLIPELLYGVLECLGQGDVYTLLPTCRANYLIAYTTAANRVWLFAIFRFHAHAVTTRT